MMKLTVCAYLLWIYMFCYRIVNIFIREGYSPRALGTEWKMLTIHFCSKIRKYLNSKTRWFQGFLIVVTTLFSRHVRAPGQGDGGLEPLDWLCRTSPFPHREPTSHSAVSPTQPVSFTWPWVKLAHFWLSATHFPVYKHLKVRDCVPAI